MKFAIVGRRNRKVYRVETGLDRDGEPETTRCASHKEVIEISDTDADRIAANDHVPFARWYIVGGELTETKPELPTLN